MKHEKGNRGVARSIWNNYTSVGFPEGKPQDNLVKAGTQGLNPIFKKAEDCLTKQSRTVMYLEMEKLGPAPKSNDRPWKPRGRKG